MPGGISFSLYLTTSNNILFGGDAIVMVTIYGHDHRHGNAQCHGNDHGGSDYHCDGDVIHGHTVRIHCHAIHQDLVSSCWQPVHEVVVCVLRVRGRGFGHAADLHVCVVGGWVRVQNEGAVRCAQPQSAAPDKRAVRRKGLNCTEIVRSHKDLFFFLVVMMVMVVMDGVVETRTLELTVVTVTDIKHHNAFLLSG